MTARSRQELVADLLAYCENDGSYLPVLLRDAASALSPTKQNTSERTTADLRSVKPSTDPTTKEGNP